MTTKPTSLFLEFFSDFHTYEIFSQRTSGRGPDAHYEQVYRIVRLFTFCFYYKIITYLPRGARLAPTAFIIFCRTYVVIL